MISKPRTALTGGLLVAVMLVSGCQARVGSAATVGNTRITTQTLDAAYRDAAGTAAGKAQGASLRTALLTQLVQLAEYREVARRENVAVSQGAIDAAYTEVVAGSADNPQTTQTYKRQAELVATQTAVGVALASRGGKVDTVQLYGVPVKDDATAKILLGKLKADIGNAAALAGQYSTIPTVGSVGGRLGNFPLTPNNGIPQAATAKVNEPFIADIEGQTPTIAVFMVTARLAGAAEAAALAKDGKVTINPRFGTWGTTTDASGNKVPGVTALASDVVIPNPQASSAAPAASLAPGASAPPVATEAPASGAPATAGPAPTGAPEPTAVPEPTAAPEPTTAPTAAPSATAVAPSAAPSS